MQNNVNCRALVGIPPTKATKSVREAVVLVGAGAPALCRRADRRGTRVRSATSITVHNLTAALAANRPSRWRASHALLPVGPNAAASLTTSCKLHLSRLFHLIKGVVSERVCSAGPDRGTAIKHRHRACGQTPFQVRSATVQHRRHGGVNGRGKGRGQGL